MRPRLPAWFVFGLLAHRSALACDPLVEAALGLDPKKQQLLRCEDVTRVGDTLYVEVRLKDLEPPPWSVTSESLELAWLTGGKLSSTLSIGEDGDAREASGALLEDGLPLYEIDARERSDGEASYHSHSLHLLTASGPKEIFAERMETDSGDGYPSHHGDFDLELTRSALGDAPDLHYREHDEACAGPDTDCTASKVEWTRCFVPPDRWTEADRCVRKPTARATTTLAPGKTARYDAALAIDGDPATAWVEGAKGPGIGARLHIDLGPQDLTGLDVLPGYAKSAEVWARNNRIRVAAIRLSDGTRTEATFEDRDAVQRVDLGGLHRGIEWVEIEIRAVYPGSHDDDTCLSEVRPVP